LKKYLSHTFSTDDPELVSVIDELSLWAAPFGLKLLDKINLKHNIKALDVGCGLGFPLIEIAQRLGETSKVFGIDPWERAIERVNKKIKKYNLTNVEVIKGIAENLPFEDYCFDLIVSNNGINNVQDMKQSLSECSRVCKPDAQFIITINLEETMIEFYNVLEDVLTNNNLNDEVEKMEAHIYSKRKPLIEIKQLLTSSGFKIKNIDTDKFFLRFTDGETMFNHSLIKYWFLDSWKTIVNADQVEMIFEQVEDELNLISGKKGEVSLTIPYVVIESTKQ